MNQTFPDVSPSKGNLVKNNLQNLTNPTKKTSSTLRWRKTFLVVQLFIAGTLLFAGCKDPDDLGLNVLPPGDQLYTDFTDTATIENQIVIEDSLQADELSLQLLGSISDKDFGVSTASVYAQVNLTGTPNFGTTPVVDSIVLVMGFSSYYGDTADQQTVNVYRLTDDMHIDSTYYTNSSFATDPTLLGTSTFYPNPKTPVVLANNSTDTLIPQIRIPLDTALANEIIGLDPTTFSSNANWLAYFKGIKIQAEPLPQSSQFPEGSISTLSFFNSAVVLYFHNDTTQKVYNFSLANARVNSFTHDFSGATVGPLINSGTVDSLCYVQGNAGVKTRISFPYLKHFTDSGSIVVNRAELKITAQENTQLLYPVAPNLLLTTRANSGTIIFPIDYYESTGYFGGAYDATSGTYTFNIARQVQGILDGTYNSSDFYLVVAASGVASNRVIVGSSSNATYKMKLSLYYTKIN